MAIPKAPSLFVSILFVVVAAMAEYVGSEKTIIDILKSEMVRFIAGTGLITSVWLLVQEHMRKSETIDHKDPMSRGLSKPRSYASRVFWG